MREIPLLRRGTAWLSVSLIGAALLFAACGDDDDNGGNRNFQVGTDEQYLQAVCGAFEDLTAAFFAAALGLGADPTDDQIVEALLEPFEEFGEALRGARVPADLQEFHGQLVDSTDQVVRALRDGDTEVLESDDAFDIADPPQEVQDRLEAVAQGIPACVDVGLFDNGF